jgi:hypothetical protein
MQKQETILFKVNTGLGYDSNNKCNPLQSQKYISPQLAMIKSITPEEANKRFTHKRPYDQASMNEYRNQYPYVFNSNPDPRLAGII